MLTEEIMTLDIVINLLDKFNGSRTGSTKWYVCDCIHPTYRYCAVGMTLLVRLFNSDAYLWAKEEYLDKGRCDPTALAYYIDYYWPYHQHDVPATVDYSVNTLTNHDYFIARRGFFMDLSPWNDESPNDDPTQPLGTDLKTLQAIFQSAWQAIAMSRQPSRMIYMAGTTPWMFKYAANNSQHKHTKEETQDRLIWIASSYNIAVAADDCPNNGMYTHAQS
jgi:hypothetical protein